MTKANKAPIDNFEENTAEAQRLSVTPTNDQHPMKPGQVADLADRTRPDPEKNEAAAGASMLVEELPDEVKKSLVGYEKMELEQLLLKVLSVPGIVYTTDRIVLSLWYNHQKKMDRMKVIARLRELTAQGLVQKEANKRGIYSLTESGRKFLGI